MWTRKRTPTCATSSCEAGLAGIGPSPEGLEETRRFFERALALDPESAEAKVGIATVLIEQVMIAASKNPDADVQQGVGTPLALPHESRAQSDLT
jgi:hypothetical protein